MAGGCPADPGAGAYDLHVHSTGACAHSHIRCGTRTEGFRAGSYHFADACAHSHIGCATRTEGFRAGSYHSAGVCAHSHIGYATRTEGFSGCTYAHSHVSAVTGCHTNAATGSHG